MTNCSLTRLCCSIEFFLDDLGLPINEVEPLLVVLMSFALSTAIKLWPTPPGAGCVCPWAEALLALPWARSCELDLTPEQDRSTEQRDICKTLCGNAFTGLPIGAAAFLNSDGLAGVWRNSVNVRTVSDTEIDLQFWKKKIKIYHYLDV